MHGREIRSTRDSEDVWKKLKMSRFNRRFLLRAFAIFTVIVFFVFLKTQPILNATEEMRSLRRYFGGLFSRSSEVSRQDNKEKSWKTILVWNIPDRVTYAKVIDERCGLCNVTSDRRKLDESDAVVIHYGINKNDLPDPKLRRKDQLYVWLCRESPYTTKTFRKVDLTKFNHYFNATMSYRRDSDIFEPYLRRPDYLPVDYLHKNISQILKEKRHMVLWVVSDCDSTEGAKERSKIVQRLVKAGLKLDLRGHCFSAKPFPPYRSKEAFERFAEYKFYLAFENSHQCRDYVTEKFWFNGLLSGAVPISWGPDKSDLVELAPPGSFIYMNDFKTPKDLVTFINKLNANDEAYSEYFKWREKLAPEAIFNSISVEQRRKLNNRGSNWMIEGMTSFGYCELCRTLHSDRMETSRSIASLDQWWYGSERKECH